MSLHKRGKIYHYDFILEGKRYTGSTKKTVKTEAAEVEKREKKKASEESEFQSNLFAKMPSLSEAAQKLFDIKWSDSTDGEGSLNRVKLIADEFGDLPLNQVSAAWISDVKRDLRKKYGTNDKGKRVFKGERTKGTINRYLANLRTILKTAHQQWEILDRVPYIQLYPESKGRIRVIKPEEQKKLTEWLKKNNRHIHYWVVADLIDFLTETGLRLSEALNLKEDNWEIQGCIQLWEKETKSGKGRVIPLSDRAAQIVSRRGSTPFKGLDKWRAGKVFNYAKQGIGLQDDNEFVLHACRHTFASRLLANGTSLYELMDLLGHASIKTTERYSHLAPDRLRKVIDSLNKKQM